MDVGKGGSLDSHRKIIWNKSLININGKVKINLSQAEGIKYLVWDIRYHSGPVDTAKRLEYCLGLLFLAVISVRDQPIYRKVLSIINCDALVLHEISVRFTKNCDGG